MRRPRVARLLALALVSLAVLAPSRARADDPPIETTTKVVIARVEPPRPRLNSIEADLGLSVVNLDYERVLNRFVAVQVGAGLFGIWWDTPKFTGFGVEVRSSFFLQGTAPGGVYIAPFVRLDGAVTSHGDDSGFGGGSAEGVFAGYSLVIARAVNLRAGTGIQYMHYAANVDGAQIEWKKLYPCLDLVAGYMF